MLRSFNEGGTYNKCLFLNAMPEPDFKYFSNSKAFDLSVNTQ